MGNTIHIIEPYKKYNTWVFNDKAKGIFQEPFVGATNTLIDRAIQEEGIPYATEGFSLSFSDTYFPTTQYVVTWVRSDAKERYSWWNPMRYFSMPSSGGNWYKCKDLMEEEFWLCPALYHYFKSAPRYIFLKFEHIPSWASAPLPMDKPIREYYMDYEIEYDEFN